MENASQTRRRKIALLAVGQHGHVTRRQLLARGVASTTIDAWIRDDRLIRIHQGVCAVGYPRVEPVALAMAAVLACGDGALLSHDSALALYGLRRWPPIPEVTTPRHVRRPGVRAHRSDTVTAADRGLWLGVPTTRPARAIADLGPRLTARQRVRLTNDARLAKHLSVDEQHRLLGHRRNPTRSAGEDVLGRWLRDADLPEKHLVNVVVNGHEVDVCFPGAKVIIELDHLATHSDPHTFTADRRHDREDADLGWRALRLTVDDLTDAEAERVRRLLHERAPDPPGCSR